MPPSIRALEMADHNQVIFPLVSKLSMHFPARGEGKPACELVWHDSGSCGPQIDEKYWDADSTGAKKAPEPGDAGTLLHRKDGAFLVQRGSHEQVSRIYPREEMLKYRDDIRVPRPQWNHQQSFTQACLENDHTRSPFDVAGPLTKVLLLGVICQYLNEDLEFDPATERFVNNDRANDLLAGPPPRKGWEGFYESI